jgi:poly(A) polymerase
MTRKPEMEKGNEKPGERSRQSAFPLPAIAEEIRLHLAGREAYLVGGATRDTLLGLPIGDIDIVIRGDGVSSAKAAADALKAPFYPLDADRGVGRVILVRGETRHTVDFASMHGASIQDDLHGRDFTVNAIAVSLDAPEKTIDPLGGEADIRRGILRACSARSVSDDPVRAVRAVRLATQLGFRLEKDTKEQVRSGAPLLGRVSAERIRDEFFRILAGRKVAAAIRSLDALGVLPAIVPETAGLARVQPPPPHRYTVWEHTIGALEKLETLIDLLACEFDEDRAADFVMGLARARLGRFHAALGEHLARPLSDERPARGLLFLAGILHDAAKPETSSVSSTGEVHFLGHEQLGADWALNRATALRFSNGEAEYIAQIVRNHMRPLLLRMGGPVSRRTVFRFFRSTGPCGVAVCLFFLADTLATHGPDLPQDVWQSTVDTVCPLLEGYFEHPAEIIRPVLLLSGIDLMREFGLPPGPQIGELLDALREAQAAGEVATMQEALDLVNRGLGRKEKPA